MSANKIRPTSRSSRVLSVLFFLHLAVPAFGERCTHLAQLKLANAAITRAETVRGGAFIEPSGDLIADLPTFCRVAVTSKPSSDSEIRIEVWMPEEGWNGSIEGTGNGGFAGSIVYNALAAGLRLRFAVANTDMGMATPPGADASIFAARPERWADWGYRSTHEMTVVAKQLVKAYYMRDAAKAYFTGCSTGGEQALSEAQRFPDDYDGIVGGAPANDRTGVHESLLWNFVQPRLTAEASLRPQQVKAISNAVLRACDASDGVEDGIVVDPHACTFSPETLTCDNALTEGCLPLAQLQTVKNLYSGPINAHTQRSAYPGLERGSETAWLNQLPSPGEAKAPPYAAIFQWVFGKAWNWRTFDFDRDGDIFYDKLHNLVNATSPDLDTFRAHGHKLLIYHGWNDTVVAPGGSVRYYDSVVERDIANSSTSDIADSYRLFMIPGMEHCGGGLGPGNFDPLGTIVRWVETGVAPDALVAQKAGANTGAARKPMQRLLCSYPETAVYRGGGDVNSATSYKCVPSNLKMRTGPDSGRKD